MGIKSKLVTLVAGLVGLSSFSQAPEFAQQYKQRLGGAVQELGVVVGDFDTNAKDALLTRDDALKKLQGSTEQFVQNRGNSMAKTIGRFTKLETQQTKLNSANSFMQPVYVLQNPDTELVKGAWSIYQPAMPLNKEGALWGGVGALLAMLLARLGISGLRRAGISGGKQTKKNAVLGKRAASKSDKVLVAQVAASSSAGYDELSSHEYSGVDISKTFEKISGIQDLKDIGLAARDDGLNDDLIGDEFLSDGSINEKNKPLLAAVDDRHADAMQFRQKIYGEVAPDGKVVQLRPKSKK